jgi:hypothetical protein
MDACMALLFSSSSFDVGRWLENVTTIRQMQWFSDKQIRYNEAELASTMWQFLLSTTTDFNISWYPQQILASCR